MWRHVVQYKFTYVSEKRTASIFQVEDILRLRLSHCLRTISSNLKMEAIGSSKIWLTYTGLHEVIHQKVNTLRSRRFDQKATSAASVEVTLYTCESKNTPNKARYLLSFQSDGGKKWMIAGHSSRAV
jgi:hypothetical protein